MGIRGEVRCLRLASTQDGVIRRDQARELGLSARQIERRVRSGRWETIFPAGYRVEGSARSWRQELRAAVLWAGRGSAISHRAAAALLGFALLGGEAPAESELEARVAEVLEARQRPGPGPTCAIGPTS